MADYDRPTIMATVCERLSGGESLRSICRTEGMPAESTVREWMASDEFAAQSTRARELGFESLAEQCIDIADDQTEDPTSRRIRIDTRIRLLGKWSQRYADKEIKQHVGADGGPIEIKVTFD